MHAAFCVLLIAAAYCSGCYACNLTERILDDTRGLVHRCLNTTGTNEWHLGAACWVRSLENDSSVVIELQFDQKYIHSSGRDVAQCRRGSYETALVYLVCFVASTNRSSIGSVIQWPGDVWTGDDGLQYTCTNASSGTSTRDFDKGSRIILYGCNSTLTGEVIEPESTEQSANGIVSKCIFNGRNLENSRYSMEAIGCWLQNRTNPGSYDQLKFGEDYIIDTKNSSDAFATCRRRYSGEALVYYKCIEKSTTGDKVRSAGSVWNSDDGIQRECLPAKPSELVSAQIIMRACKDNKTLLAPSSETRMEDGSVWRCVFSRYNAEYGWFEAVGCWPKDSYWSSVANFSNNVKVGQELCLTNRTCLGKCEKRRYHEEVALLATVCFENVGHGVKYRRPYENWTDDSGINRTCIPIADQSSKFGVGAETILRGCESKIGNGTVAPGALFFDSKFLVYECSYNSYQREYNFQETVGCWMHDSNGQRIIIANGEAFRLTRNQTVATCRKRRYSRRVEFTVEVCFKDNQMSLLNWSTSGIAFPKDTIRTDSTIRECDPAATYSDGVDAKWIVYGCPHETDIVSPGSTKLSVDGIIWECAHNDREGSSAAYSWVKPVGCWFKDHKKQIISIDQFNVVYKHPSLNIDTAICEYRRYSEPNLKMLVCLSQANSRFYNERDKWTDEETGLAKQCISTSRYSSNGVTIIDAGCWLQAHGKNISNAALSSLFSGNGSVASAAKNRVLRCDFNERNRRYEWSTSVACWYTDENSGTFTVLPTGQEYWFNGMLIYKCLQRRTGAVFVKYSCKHNGTWHAAMTTWRDVNYKYKCQPASGENDAEVQKTHCIADGGTLLTESQKIKGIQYVCMRICGFLVFIRDPTPEYYRLLFSFINNCHATNMNIINSIG